MEFLTLVCNLLPMACLFGVLALAGVWLVGFVALALLTGGGSLGHIGSCEGCLLFPFGAGVVILALAGGAWLLVRGWVG